MPVDTGPAVRLAETYKTAIAKWRKTSQMDKVEIFILVMAVVIFLVLILALITLEASGSGAGSRDRGVLRVESGQGLASLTRNLNLKEGSTQRLDQSLQTNTSHC
jgi:hypothetical protein